MKRLITILGTLAWLATQGTALASGVLIPKDNDVPPLAIKSQRVDIRIKDGVANVKLEQTFKNSVDRDLEAVYVFPLPENAGIADFAMYIGGKRVSGELVEKGKARSIYEDIVRRMKDPGLLESMGGNLFRVSVYPVPRNGEQKIELAYSQTLSFDAGLYAFTYPLRTGNAASRTLEDFTVGVKLISAEPIKTVYSPSHQVGITRKGDHEATLGFEENRALLDRDFTLYYGVSKKDFGLNLLTHAVKGEDGYFMAMIAPTVAPPEGLKMPKDIVFVFDTSGSMAGKKIEQARQALEYCVRKLNPGDRFNIVRFSTEAEPFAPDLAEADEKTRDRALAFVKGIEGRGGTAVQDALRCALGMKFEKTRPAMIVFLTDGKPTIGETDIEAILTSVKKLNGEAGASRRIFVFGVGDEVNTLLLDRLAAENGGSPSYVKPEEDIEVKVSALADKISRPVLTRPVLAIDKLKVKQVHPQPLPDLFCGDQLTVFGRYEGDGHVAIRLKGEVNGKPQEYVFEGTFPPVNADNEFVPRLWATRRVGHLLDEIRLRGEDAELKQEVVRLGKEYGIMTPYTSYLVLEDDQAYRQRNPDRTPGPPPPSRPEPIPLPMPMLMNGTGAARTMGMGGALKEAKAPAAAAVPVDSDRAADMVRAATRAKAEKGGERQYTVVTPDSRRADEYLRAQEGRDAVQLSEAIQDYKRKDVAGEQLAGVRRVEGRVFYLIGGVWVDSRYKETMKRVTVKFAGDDYFKFVADNPEIRKCLALGEKVIVCLDENTAVVVE